MNTAKPTPLYKHRLLQDFGPRQRELLLKANSQGVELNDPLATEASRVVPDATRADVLEAAGLIHKRTSKKQRTSWRTTDVGRAVVSTHVPRFLAARSEFGYTHLPHRALWQEPEAA
jgi:hypothetical protein